MELKVSWGAKRLRPGPDGLRTADALNLESETRMATQYVADTSSGAAAGRLTSENTTGHVLRPAADRSFCGSVLQAVICRPKCVALKRHSYQVHCDTFDWAGGWGWGPHSETPPEGGPAFSFWTPASSFVEPIVYSKGLPGHNAPSMGVSEKYKVLEMHQDCLAPPNDTYGGYLVRTGATGMPEGCPPT